MLGFALQGAQGKGGENGPDIPRWVVQKLASIGLPKLEYGRKSVLPASFDVVQPKFGAKLFWRQQRASQIRAFRGRFRSIFGRLGLLGFGPVLKSPWSSIQTKTELAAQPYPSFVGHEDGMRNIQLAYGISVMILSPCGAPEAPGHDPNDARGNNKGATSSASVGGA